MAPPITITPTVIASASDARFDRECDSSCSRARASTATWFSVRGRDEHGLNGNPKRGCQPAKEWD
jgi:hypothetical protein